MTRGFGGLNVYIPPGKMSFNPVVGEEISIRFEVVDEAAEVEVGIYNIVGELIDTIVSPDEGEYDPNVYIRTWDGKSGPLNEDVASGIYLVYCKVGGDRFIRKVALINE